jgi:Zn finger protein HypA/HybF involved in hydrogenase expression
MECEYGCGNVSNFVLKNGKHCCSTSPNSCPSIKAKNSKGLQKAHTDGKMRYDQFDDVRAWSKGKTHLTDDRLSKSVSTGGFTENSDMRTSEAKRILLKEGILQYKCSRCELTEWLGEPITLELDHINGNSRDNRIENFRLLCPNCHSQTPTFRRRGTRGVDKKISDEDLINALREHKNINKALTEVNLSAASGNVVRAKKLLTLIEMFDKNKEE